MKMAVSLKDGVLCFRHPLVKDKNDYGKVIRKAIGKLPLLDQEQTKLDLEKLLKATPGTREDAAPLKVCKAALDAYFAPLAHDDEKQEVLNYAATVCMELADAYREGLIDYSTLEVLQSSKSKKAVDIRLVQRLLARISLLQTQCNKVAKERDDAIDQLAGYVRATGEQTAEQKALTLEQCLEHFKAHVHCKSLPTKRRLLSRVTMIVDALGFQSKHAAITRKAIEDAVQQSSPNSDSEALYRKRDIRRFFRELSRPTAQDGLGLQDPASTLPVGSIEKIQRQRRKSGKIVILDPKDLFKNDGLDLYWRALIAVIGYGGLRLGEAAALTWENIAERTGLIQVRTSAAYPELKSVMSERNVKPFLNLWPILKKYKKIARHKSLVFDRVGDAGPTWFRTYEGKPTAADLTRAFIGAIGAAEGMHCELKDGRKLTVEKVSRGRGKVILHVLGETRSLKFSKDEIIILRMPKEPARRLRRFWETTMREKGLGHLIEAMGGHSDEVGKAHYTKYDEIVSKASVGKA